MVILSSRCYSLHPNLIQNRPRCVATNGLNQLPLSWYLLMINYISTETHTHYTSTCIALILNFLHSKYGPLLEDLGLNSHQRQHSCTPMGPNSLYSVLDMNPLLEPWSTTNTTLAATCAPRNPASSVPASFHSGKYSGILAILMLVGVWPWLWELWWWFWERMATAFVLVACCWDW